MATTEMRLQNAVRRVYDERVRPIHVGRGQYLVASSTQPGQGYAVYVDGDGTVSCSCTAAQWDVPCKHAVAVQLLEQEAAPALAA